MNANLHLLCYLPDALGFIGFPDLIIGAGNVAARHTHQHNARMPPISYTDQSTISARILIWLFHHF